jgi:hypothetical protein
VPAAVQLASENEAAAQTRAYRDEREVVDPASDTAPLLAERSEVDVVLDVHRLLEARTEGGRERLAFQTRHVLGERDA